MKKNTSFQSQFWFHPLHNHGTNKRIRLFFPFSLFMCFRFNRMVTVVWMVVCVFVVASAGNFRKQKMATTAAIKNSTLAREIYLTQQHMLQHTR